MIKNKYVISDCGYVTIDVTYKGGSITMLVDDVGFTLLCSIGGTISARECSGKPYFTIRKDGRNEYIHRLITGCPKGKVVDHVNRVTSDNRSSNLRAVSRSENMFNLGGIRGIDQQAVTKRWRARIFVQGQEHHLGYFGSFEEACVARAYAERIVNPLSEVQNVAA